MATKFPTILPSDPQARIHYNQFRKKLIGTNIYLNDPEYLKLMRQYIVSLETYVRNIKEESAFFGKAHLTGPRRQIDFYKLETARGMFVATQLPKSSANMCLGTVTSGCGVGFLT